MHVVHGEAAQAPAARVEEIAGVARFLRNRMDRDSTGRRIL